jgi:ATP-binding cassette, subfamily B, bacterial
VRSLSARALLATYLRPQWRRSVVLTALLFIGIGLELGNPQILRAFIDSAVAGAEINQLLAIGLVFLLVALATQVVMVAETYVAENLGLTATNALRADLTRHCLGLDPDFLNAHTPGELIERIDGDVSTLANYFARFVIYVVGNALLILGLLVLLILIDWRVAAAVGVFLLLALLMMTSLRFVAVPHWNMARQASAELFGFIEERLLGTEDIRASGATAYVMRRFYERSRRLLRRELLASALGNAAFQSGAFFLTIGTAVGLAVGAYLYLAGAISLGSVYLIFAYAQVLTRPIEEISRQMQQFQQAGAGLARVRQLLAIQPRIIDGTRDLPHGPLRVEFDGVSFGYAADEPIVSDLSFRLEPGEVLAVVGRTGIGKTTLARLLLRLYDPQHGAIRLQGQDLRALRLTALRERVALVTQEVQLFHASLRDNLTLFDARIPDRRMLEVLEQVGLEAWLRRMPRGLDTLLTAGGGGVSAGEAQLLAFARVFLREPGLVILDEASSRLDPATERHIEEAIDSLLRNRTAIVIAHRPATIQRVDRVLALESGFVPV